MVDLRRREFITLFGGAAAGWPLATRAGERLPRIAVRTGMDETDAVFRDRMAAFRHELQQLGWTDGRNVRIDVRAGNNNPEQYLTKEQQKACLDSAAAELVREITQQRPLN
jgi:hypothetical protein